MKKIIYICILSLFLVWVAYATVTIARESKSDKLLWQGTTPNFYDPKHNVGTSYKSEQSFEFVNGTTKWVSWIVKDKNTGLFWESENKAWEKSWEQAKAYCEALDKWWKTNWRLPTISELEWLVDFSRYYPAINTNYFTVVSDYYWSSTTRANFTGSAWVLYFRYGYTDWNYKPDSNYVLCVSDPE